MGMNFKKTLHIPKSLNPDAGTEQTEWKKLKNTGKKKNLKLNELH